MSIGLLMLATIAVPMVNRASPNIERLIPAPMGSVIAQLGDRVTVDYEVRAGKKLIDSTQKRGLAYTFVLGKPPFNLLTAPVMGVGLGRTKFYKVKNRPKPTALKSYLQFDSDTVLTISITLRKLKRGDAVLLPG